MDNNTFCGLSKGPTPASFNDVFSANFNRAGATPAPDYPGAIWHASPNFWPDRDGQSVIAICNHIMQSSFSSADGWFMNPASEVSAHFGITKDGKVYQWVRTDSAAWCNGIMNKPNMAIGWVAECATQGINPNLRSIGIEHEGNTGDPMPEAQYQATLALQKWVVATYNVKVDSQHIIRHADIDSVNRRYCPGSGFPMARLLADLAPQTTPTPQSTPNARYFPETGFYIDNDYGFLDYWNNNGGLAIFGLPIQPAHFDPVLNRVMQYMERARFEAHPEAPEAYRVQLGLLGRELTGIK
jgi:N-acetyl-anhydromuramyl-L-alanine amidase AmpD